MHGFIAHEFSSVVPMAVKGDKDATEIVETAVWYKNGNLKEKDITEEEFNQKLSDGDYDKYEGQEFEWDASRERIVPQKMDDKLFIPFLVKAVKELSAKVTALENA